MSLSAPCRRSNPVKTAASHPCVWDQPHDLWGPLNSANRGSLFKVEMLWGTLYQAWPSEDGFPGLSGGTPKAPLGVSSPLVCTAYTSGCTLHHRQQTVSSLSAKCGVPTTSNSMSYVDIACNDCNHSNTDRHWVIQLSHLALQSQKRLTLWEERTGSVICNPF